MAAYNYFQPEFLAKEEVSYCVGITRTRSAEHVPAVKRSLWYGILQRDYLLETGTSFVKIQPTFSLQTVENNARQNDPCSKLVIRSECRPSGG